MDDKGNIVGDKTRFPFLHGGHQDIEGRLNAVNVKKGLQRFPTIHWDSEDRLGNLAGFMSDMIGRTSLHSIPEYCQQNRIPLTKNEDGTFTLHGKPHILIKGSEWENIKKQRGSKIGTKGSLIEFVANHKQMTILEALADITGNEKLLLLEKHLGKMERTYMEFHIPKNKRLNEDKSMSLLNRLGKHLGHRSDFSKAIYRTKKVEASTKNTIRFLFGDKPEGAIEYRLEASGTWTKKALGFLRSGFIKQSGSSRNLQLFKDPFVFMNETNGKGVSKYLSRDNILVLGDENMESLDFFLAHNPRIKNIDLFGFESKELSSSRKKELSKNNITFTFMKGGEKSRQRNKNIELSL